MKRVIHTALVLAATLTLAGCEPETKVEAQSAPAFTASSRAFFHPRTVRLGYEVFFSSEGVASQDVAIPPEAQGTKIAGIIGGNLRVDRIGPGGKLACFDRAAVALAEVVVGGSTIVALSTSTQAGQAAIQAKTFAEPIALDSLRVNLAGAGCFPMNAELQVILER